MQKNVKKNQKDFLLNEWFYIALTSIFIVLAFFFFKWGQEIHFAKKGFIIDSSLFGAYGDFIGGVLGTVFSLMSVLLVIKTFQHQRAITIKNNEQVEIQRFHDLFFELLRIYQSQVNELCGSISRNKTEVIKYNNKDYFDYEKRIIQDRFRNRKSFASNQQDSVKYYMLFYIENQAKLGAYFRTIYRIYDLIDSSGLKESVKRDYLKIMRAQLTESELFFLRYNAMTYYGFNFIDYINKYHILKHLPAFELLEFKDWWSDLNPIEKTGVNIVFSSISRGVRRLLVSDQKEYVVLPSMEGEKYFLKVYSSKPSEIILSLTISDKLQNHYNEFGAFEKFEAKRIQQLFDCFIKEIFLYSSFKRFNVIDELELFSTPVKTTKEGITYIDSGIRNVFDKPLRVSMYNKNDS